MDKCNECKKIIKENEEARLMESLTGEGHIDKLCPKCFEKRTKTYGNLFLISFVIVVILVIVFLFGKCKG